MLDALLRSGLQLPYSCKSGVCGSCMMRAAPETPPPPRAQIGLKDSWRAQGYVLPCVCQPEGDLLALPIGDEVRVAASIESVGRLSASVLRVGVQLDAPFDGRAGQFITLLRGDGLARSYSIASLSRPDSLELHVRVIANGRMSQWLASGGEVVGVRVQVQGPSGECFYLGGREDQPLLLAGTGTGLAPLYGILRDALAQGHRGPIHLFHGALDRDGFYLEEELTALASQHANLVYTPTAFATDGAIDRVILGCHPGLAGWRVFLCGDPGVVQTCRKKIFLSGAALNDIHADAFQPSAS